MTLHDWLTVSAPEISMALPALIVQQSARPARLRRRSCRCRHAGLDRQRHHGDTSLAEGASSAAVQSVCELIGGIAVPPRIRHCTDRHRGATSQPYDPARQFMRAAAPEGFLLGKERQPLS